MSDNYILTFTGRRFWPLEPREEDVSILDIAHALSCVGRFTGHVRRFYSVAEHSLLVSKKVAPKYALWGLLHDASEAYLSDLAKPVKHCFPNYVAAEKTLMQVILRRFGMALIEPPKVKIEDTRALVTEARDLLPSPDNDWSHLGKPYPETISPVRPSEGEIENRFLLRFQQLTKGCKWVFI